LAKIEIEFMACKFSPPTFISWCHIAHSEYTVHSPSGGFILVFMMYKLGYIWIITRKKKLLQ